MSVQQVAIRLKPEGGGDVVREAQIVEAALVKASTSAATATDKAIAANDRQIASLRELDTAAALAARGPTPTQMRIDQLAGGSSRLGLQDQASRPGNARADIAARSLYAADAEYERRAQLLRQEIDPLGAALDRLNKELAEYAQLAKVGAIGTRELAAAEALARTRFDETTASLNRQTGGLTRRAAAGRLNLARQGADVFTTAAMGMNPGMIAIQQGPQILEALSESGIKASRSLLLLGGAVTAAAAGVVVLTAAWMDGEEQSLKLDRAVTGLGRTSGMTSAQLDLLARAGAEQAEISIASARDQAAAYVSTGKISGQVISTLIGLSKDYAALMGTDMAQATEDLAKGMSAPDKMARELTRSIGLLDQKTLDHIDSLIALGRRQEAQIVLSERLADAISGQADRVGSVTSAWDAAARAVSNYWEKLGQALYTTPEERLSRLDATIANGRRDRANPAWIAAREQDATELRFQLGYEAARAANQARVAAANQQAQEARDRRDRLPKARVDRSGEREARERLQSERREEDRATNLDLEIARSRNDAQRVQELQDELAVRQRIRELVDANVSASAAQTKAEAEQARLVAAREPVIERELDLRGRGLAIDDARERGNHASLQALEDINREQETYNAYLAITHNRAAANLLTEIELMMVATNRADALERAASAADREHRLGLARASGNARLTRDLEGEAWREQRARAIEDDLKLDRGEGDAAAAREYRQRMDAEWTGSARSWTKSLVGEIDQSGIGDALARQFDRAKTKLLDGLVDLFFDGFSAKGGSGGTGNLFAQGLNFLFGRNANGTDYWPGGMSLVGERGPEFVDLPRGARVTNNARSMALMRGGLGSGQTVTENHYYLQGAVTTDELWTRIDRGDARAAQSGAARGAGTAVGIVRSSAEGEQRSSYMLKG